MRTGPAFAECNSMIKKRFNKRIYSLLLLMILTTLCSFSWAQGNNPRCQAIFQSNLNSQGALLAKLGYSPSVANRLEKQYPDIANKILRLGKTNAASVTVYRGIDMSVNHYLPTYTPAGKEAIYGDPKKIYVAMNLEGAVSYASWARNSGYDKAEKDFDYYTTIVEMQIPEEWLQPWFGGYVVFSRKKIPNDLILVSRIGIAKFRVNKGDPYGYEATEIRWYPVEAFFDKKLQLRKDANFNFTF